MKPKLNAFYFFGAKSVEVQILDLNKLNIKDMFKNCYIADSFSNNFKYGFKQIKMKDFKKVFGNNKKK